MNTGIPKESMLGEGRVALVPAACAELVATGQHVFIEHDAGRASGYEDAAYQAAGVVICATAAELYASAELIVKVKQPLAHDLQYLNARHLLFSYLHLAADPELVAQLCSIGLTAIPFEAVAGDNGGYPLLAPMSAIAGRLSVIRGASLLFSNRGGRGVLLGGVSGAEPGRVVVLGAGIAGSFALMTALQLGALVQVFDINEHRLAALKLEYPALRTAPATAQGIAAACVSADLVVGAVMLAGRRAPKVVRADTVAAMREGSVIIDIAIDQGGCVENIRPTSAEELVYRHQGVLHSAVPNMPGAVPRTASQSLSAAIAPYVAELAGGGLAQSVRLLAAVALRDHAVVDPVLQQELA